MGSVTRECTARMGHLRKQMSTSARILTIKSAFASKLSYRAKMQAPAKADHIMKSTQQKLDYTLFGKGAYITYDLAHQPREDGGLGQIHMPSKLAAEWGALAIEMHRRDTHWGAMWRKELREVYGDLAEDIVTSTCSFHLFSNGKASEVQKRAMKATSG
eukprot:7387920-Prymnesium_polylepis.1